jgi:hypothetical protein
LPTELGAFIAIKKQREDRGRPGAVAERTSVRMDQLELQLQELVARRFSEGLLAKAIGYTFNHWKSFRPRVRP